MIRRALRISAFVLLAWGLPGCPATGNRSEEPAVRQAPAWVKTELYFGMARPGGGEIGEEEWNVFLAKEIAPRFPEGLTVLDACGQWRDTSGTIVREKTKLLILLHENSPEREEALEELVRIFKERFRQESVLRVRQQAEVRF